LKHIFNKGTEDNGVPLRKLKNNPPSPLLNTLSFLTRKEKSRDKTKIERARERERLKKGKAFQLG
jgi:hypothetical protein